MSLENHFILGPVDQKLRTRVTKIIAGVGLLTLVSAGVFWLSLQQSKTENEYIGLLH